MSHEIFKTNPDLEKVYVTSDNEAFYQENDAKNHAKSLKDKAVETVFNPKSLDAADAEELSDEEKEVIAFDAAEKDKEAKAELEKSLLDFDPETTNQPDAAKLFKALGMEAKNLKKETIFPLLAEAKAKAIAGINIQE